MHFHILTLFPDMVLRGLRESIIGRAESAGHICIEALNIRDYTLDKHKKVDDYPYGGGAGMLMQAQPVYDAYLEVERRILERREKEGSADKRTPRVVYVTPQGAVFRQEMAKEFAGEEDLILLCGHYEGIDERVLETIVTDYVSIGDYVLTGGELPAMVMVDAIARMVPGVLTNQLSGETESFSDNLLEYPQYTRPENWNDRTVPAILLSGDHAKVDDWRLQMAKQRTQERRPDLYALYEKTNPVTEKKRK
ncbi:tRNA (guanosine(37)-N1)-methyltransferase TrmD [bacterium 1XD8-76]|nr:tRNA (guanosine(37)-N1)-methyltransferase TrmD [bacterium 1XD8-76]